VCPPPDDAAPVVAPADDDVIGAPAVGRGGTQVIPRPPTWRPGAPAPWAGLPPERRRPSLDDVRAALAAGPPPRRSNLEGSGARASAVLAPLYEHRGDVFVVLTRRAQHLRSHRGEVSFPGGRREPGEGVRDTALREAHEEVGLPPEAVEIVGELDHLQTVSSGSYIVPFVGVLAGRPELVPSPHEVELVLHVPLAELLADGVFHSERWGLAPLDHELWFFDLVGDTVWGATASMLRNLLALATGVAGRELRE
jgi:8-oxo-dGTP pyrophosphatase MutT (NUDIX family)